MSRSACSCNSRRLGRGTSWCATGRPVLWFLLRWILSASGRRERLWYMRVYLEDACRRVPTGIRILRVESGTGVRGPLVVGCGDLAHKRVDAWGRYRCLSGLARDQCLVSLP